MQLISTADHEEGHILVIMYLFKNSFRDLETERDRFECGETPGQRLAAQRSVEAPGPRGVHDDARQRAQGWPPAHEPLRLRPGAVHEEQLRRLGVGAHLNVLFVFFTR